MTILYRGLVSGQYVYWDGNASIPVGATDIIQVSNTETLKYPDIDTNTILAWTFSGSSGNIPNIGAAGSGADMITIGPKVIRNVPGPITSGMGANGLIEGTRVYTAQGSGASLGTSNFTNSITLTAFFSLYMDPTTTSGYPTQNRNILLKAYGTTWPYTGIYQGAYVCFNGPLLEAVFQTAAGFRFISISTLTAQTFGYGMGMHMVSVSYGTEGSDSVFRLYYDGVLLASKSYSPQSDVTIGAASPNEGPWNVFGHYVNPSSNMEGMGGVLYHARAENVVRSADWVRQAWNNFNGW